MTVEELVTLLQAGGDTEKAFKKDFEVSLAANGGRKVDAFPAIIHTTHVVTYLDGVEKSISLVDFKSIIDEVTKSVAENITPVNLPYGCFMFSRSGDTTHLNCYYPEKIAEIKFDSFEGNTRKLETYKIPMPNMVLSFMLKKTTGDSWGVQQVKYFCTPRTVSQLPDRYIIVKADSDQGVYKLPFSNVYETDMLCYGGNTMPMRFTDNLRGLDYYYQILTISPFNSDLGIKGIGENITPRNWYKHLSTLTKFPYEKLTPTRR